MLEDVNADEACINYILKEALAQGSDSLNDDEKANLAKLCEHSCAMVCKLRTWAQADKTEADQSIPAPPSSAMGAEVLELYQQVHAADERVRKLRQDIPVELSEAMLRELTGSRPALPQQIRLQPSVVVDAATAEAGQGQSLQPQQVSSISPSDAIAHKEGMEMDAVPDLDSWKQLNDMTNKVPALMARLDQTLQRLTRIIDITEADQCRPSPRTVEKVLLNHGQRDTDFMKDDSELGAENTRKRLAYDLGA